MAEAGGTGGKLRRLVESWWKVADNADNEVDNADNEVDNADNGADLRRIAEITRFAVAVMCASDFGYTFAPRTQTEPRRIDPRNPNSWGTVQIRNNLQESPLFPCAPR